MMIGIPNLGSFDVQYFESKGSLVEALGAKIPILRWPRKENKCRECFKRKTVLGERVCNGTGRYRYFKGGTTYNIYPHST